MKAPSKGLSREWRVSRQYRTAYTGGKVEISSDESYLACQCEKGVSFLDLESGLVTSYLKEIDPEIADEDILTFSLNPRRKELMTASRNLTIRIWDLEKKTCVKRWRGHRLPMISASYDASGTLVATGGSDRIAMVWDVAKGHATHSFRGHNGIVTGVRFHPDAQRLLLFTTSDDTDIRVWDLVTHKCVATLDAHLGTAPSIAFAPDGWTMLSAGRDKIVNVWELRTYAKIKTVPTFESLEGIAVIQDSPSLSSKDGVRFVTAGERGALREWTLVRTKNNTYTCSETRKELGRGQRSIPYVALLKRESTSDVVGITADQCMLTFSTNRRDDAETWTYDRQIVGFNDDIFDLKYVPSSVSSSGDSETFIMATNSEQARLVDGKTFDSTPLTGHTAMVLAVGASPCGNFVASASKDNTCRVWDVTTGRCRATCIGHTDAVGAVVFPRLSSSFGRAQAWIITASKDKTIKAWNLRGLFSVVDTNKGEDAVSRVPTLATHMAHDKDINAVAIAPNDRLIATASQDKTIKLWTMDPSSSTVLAPAGTLSGHRRGVWTVQFSPVDRCVVSGSADRTIRLWSLEDRSCIATFEGHTASVLRVHFARAGMQLLSAGADGLIKLWTIRNSECANTFEGHESKIWAMEMASDGKRFLTGGSDSTIKLWTDVTSEVENESLAREERKILEEQDMRNLSRAGKHIDAAVLAVKLDRPRQLEILLRKILEREGESATETLCEFVRQVAIPKKKSIDDETKNVGRVGILRIAEYASHWNRSSKGSSVAQAILEALFRTIDVEDLTFLAKSRASSSIGRNKGSGDTNASLVEILASFTDRHYRRFNRLLEASYVIDYSLHSMGALESGVGGERDAVVEEAAEEKQSVTTEEVVEEKNRTKKRPTPVNAPDEASTRELRSRKRRKGRGGA